MIIVLEQSLEALVLARIEQVNSRKEGPAGSTQGVVFATPATVQLSLESALALVESFGSELDDIEGVHDRDRLRER
ncbi:hypothetical protein [Schaalia cardiffensis]